MSSPTSSSTGAPASAEQAAAADAARRKAMRGMVTMMLVDIGLPVATYYLLTSFGVRDWLALTVGGLVAGLRAVFPIVRDRKVDGFAVFILALFAFGLVMAFVTGDARFVLAKDSVGTGLAGLVMLGTCVVGKPLIFYSTRKFMSGGDPLKVQGWNHLWDTQAGFRHGQRVLTVVWGVGMLTEAVVRVVLVYLLPISVMVGLSTVLQIVTFGGLIAFSMVYGKRMQAKGAARFAAAGRPGVR